jgi:hypothetical protein
LAPIRGTCAVNPAAHGQPPETKYPFSFQVSATREPIIAAMTGSPKIEYVITPEQASEAGQALAKTARFQKIPLFEHFFTASKTL